MSLGKYRESAAFYGPGVLQPETDAHSVKGHNDHSFACAFSASMAHYQKIQLMDFGFDYRGHPQRQLDYVGPYSMELCSWPDI